jgi:hypothetical protein
MSFHFAVIKSGGVYIASDLRTYDKPVLESKQRKNGRAAISFVGNLSFGRLYAEWALSKDCDYSTGDFTTASAEWCKGTWGERFAPYAAGQDKTYLIAQTFIASRDVDGAPFILSIDKQDDGEFQHRIYTAENSFVACKPSGGEKEVVERGLFPLLCAPRADAELFWKAFQQGVPLVFEELNRVNRNVSAEHETARI